MAKYINPINGSTPDRLPEGAIGILVDDNGRERLIVGPLIYTWKSNKDHFICGACNGKIKRTDDCIRFNYCPYCGTKMHHTLFTDTL